MRRLVRAHDILPLFVFLCSAAWGQSIVRSPDAVRGALAGMNEVVEHSGQLIASHSYDQLPAQANQFEARLIAFEQGIGTQPSELKSKLEPLIAKARVASSAMSEAAQSHRDSLLPITHRQLAGSVNAIIAAIPPALRPTPSG
jgi:hypothetical protein